MEEKGRRLALQAVFTRVRVRVHEHGGGGGERGEGERESSVSCIREGGTRGRKTGNTDLNWKTGSYILCISSLRRSYITWKCAGRRVFNQGGDLRFTGCLNINETPLPERVQNDSP